MSGSATTQALALAALTGAGQGATAAGQHGVANAAMAAQKDIEMAKIAAGLVTGGLAGGTGTVSEQGSKINKGKSLDERTDKSDGAGAAEPASSHKAQAAEGQASGVLAILRKLIGVGKDSAGNGGVELPTVDGENGQTAEPKSTGGATSRKQESAPSSAASATTPPSTPPGSDGQAGAKRAPAE